MFSSSFTIDLAAGSSCDYAYDNEGVLYSYALELRDTGTFGKPLIIYYWYILQFDNNLIHWIDMFRFWAAS